MSKKVPVTLLDLAVIPEGQHPRDAVKRVKALAQTAERSGFNRIWLAEHHGMHAVASAATSTLLAGVGAVTERIRLGAGGVMLPNHAPLIIAEQYGTLDALYPGRIDLGLGRAPGTDPVTAQALGRDIQEDAKRYPDDIAMLRHYFSEEQADITAVPGHGAQVPLWLLGSSLYSAQLAAELGLPYSFASHFAPDALFDAITLYRNHFKPSEQQPSPYVAAGMMVVVAETQAEANRRFTSLQMQFAQLGRSENHAFPAPVDDIRLALMEREIRGVNASHRYAAVGTPEVVEAKIREFVDATDIDELILSFPLYEQSHAEEAIGAVGDMKNLILPMS
ncbi:LLM class flavin-dependent oxidoreductase [Alteromonas halophila]|uniref:Luciferase-like monooxygenase n=1 Tax=Alteromonas halophila TaxID=516698 RepID=A0A918JL44_9ALTE|nr:LLM class flavin-dependent oxidoreductase [Alteromonas halophila]GGW84279.1 alkane 1-monooxygenase [Alteromonas halophila]